MSVEFNTTCIVGAKEIPAKLYYSDDDPACVDFTFYNMGQNTSVPTWTFGRDLIKQALDNQNEESGQCDVKVIATGDTVSFVLASPEGIGVATFLRPVIDEFIEFVYDEVPEGEDHYEVPDEFPEEWLV